MQISPELKKKSLYGLLIAVIFFLIGYYVAYSAYLKKLEADAPPVIPATANSVPADAIIRPGARQTQYYNNCKSNINLDFLEIFSKTCLNHLLDNKEIKRWSRNFIRFVEKYGAVESGDIDAIIENAKKGNYDSNLTMGLLLYCGYKIPQNLIKSQEILDKLDKEGHSVAYCLIGIVYLSKSKSKADILKGITWFEKWAKEDNPLAYAFLAAIYLQLTQKDLSLKNQLYYHFFQKTDDYIKAYMWLSVLKSHYSTPCDAVNQHLSELAKDMSSKNIRKAEHMATAWWNKYHLKNPS